MLPETGCSPVLLRVTAPYITIRAAPDSALTVPPQANLSFLGAFNSSCPLLELYTFPSGVGFGVPCFIFCWHPLVRHAAPSSACLPFSTHTTHTHTSHTPAHTLPAPAPTLHTPLPAHLCGAHLVQAASAALAHPTLCPDLLPAALHGAGMRRRRKNINMRSRSPARDTALQTRAPPRALAGALLTRIASPSGSISANTRHLLLKAFFCAGGRGSLPGDLSPSTLGIAFRASDGRA